MVFQFTSPAARAAIGGVGCKPSYYRQRASRACDDPAVMQLLLVTRKRAFFALNFVTFILAPLSLLFFLLFCLFFFYFLPYRYFRLSCSFLCIGKASLEPAIDPRVLGNKKGRPALSGRSVKIAVFPLDFLPRLRYTVSKQRGARQLPPALTL